MAIFKSIIEKLQLNELALVLLIASLILTFLPENEISRLGLSGIIQYRMYISLCLLITSSYFFMTIIFKIIKSLRRQFFSLERYRIKYMKTYMSPEEMELLIKTFYNSNNNLFTTSGLIELNNGLKAGLEAKHVIYRSAQISTYGTFISYNLQPYARNFLNKNLNNGNIKLNADSF